MPNEPIYRPHICWIFLLTLGLSGCGSEVSDQQERFIPNQPVTDIVYNTATGAMAGAWKSVQTPFEDLDLIEKPIPEKLQRISDNPYIFPAPLLCNTVRKEIAELDAVLGPDVCTQENPTGATPKADPPSQLPWQTVNICTPQNPTGASKKGAYIDQGANMAKERASNEVSSKVNVIPFRSYVRQLTGAEKHAKEYERAYQAGKLRRAFLKGLEVSLGPECVNRSMSLPPVNAATPQAATAHSK